MFDNTAEAITFWKTVGQRVQSDIWVGLGIFATDIRINVSPLAHPPHASVECYLPELNKTIQLNVAEEAVEDIYKLELALEEVVDRVRPYAEDLARYATYH